MKLAIGFFLVAALANAPASIAGITGGHIHLVNGNLEIHVEDTNGASTGINDILNLFLAEKYDVDDSNSINGSTVVLISSGERIPTVSLYGVVYQKAEARQIVKARITVPASDKFWTSFSGTSPFMSFEGAGAAAFYELVKKHGRMTMDDGRITRFESGEVLCYLRHDDGGHSCFIDL
jgi:hypothetical protein